MKEQYIRQVEKELNLSRKAKTEVVRDLNEIFNSAVEHGETEQLHKFIVCTKLCGRATRFTAR